MANDPKVLSTATPVATTAPADGTTHTLDDGRVIAGARDAPAVAVAELYTPAEDVTATDADGRVTLIATGGVPIPRAEAERLGLVKHAQRHGPEETK